MKMSIEFELEWKLCKKNGNLDSNPFQNYSFFEIYSLAKSAFSFMIMFLGKWILKFDTDNHVKHCHY